MGHIRLLGPENCGQLAIGLRGPDKARGQGQLCRDRDLLNLVVMSFIGHYRETPRFQQGLFGPVDDVLTGGRRGSIEVMGEKDLHQSVHP